MYTMRRFLRTGSIHGLSRFSSLMNTVYRKYLGDEPYGFYPEPVQNFGTPSRNSDSPPGLRGGPDRDHGDDARAARVRRRRVQQVRAARVAGRREPRQRRRQGAQVAGAGVSAPKRDLKAEDFR